METEITQISYLSDNQLRMVVRSQEGERIDLSATWLKIHLQSGGKSFTAVHDPLGEVSSLDITLANGKDNVINEYMFQFTSGATATTLVLPADIKWVSAPNIQANKTYQVSIINNLGVIGEFGNE